MANDTVCSVMDAPGSRVMGWRLALMRSGSTASPAAAGPMPVMPFSLCKRMSLSGGR